jgi:amidophosphoribosyltransferase
MFDIEQDKLKEECGVFGIYDYSGELDCANLSYFALTALQHRGQESAGIAISKDGKIDFHKGMGLVQEVFNPDNISKLKGNIAIGHVRYSTAGESFINNAQPLVVRFRGGDIALAHNGNLINAYEIRNELEKKGSIFQTSIDSEVIANLIAMEFDGDILEAIKSAVGKVRGSFALTIAFNGYLIGVRDPYGLRPLVLGKLDDGYVLASETAALDVVGATFERDVCKGEIVLIKENHYEIHKYDNSKRKAICSFEYVYFARPDSEMDSRNVYMARLKAGELLYKSFPVEADIVVPVPDSGIPAAIGFSKASGIPFELSLIKNKYMGRSFIEPDQHLREQAVKLKLNVIGASVKDKKVVLIDDSIVRGTTSKRIIQMIKDAGAKEVHVRVSSPPVIHSCYFGIDTPTRKQLIGATNTLDEIREMIGADSLGYLNVEDLVDSIDVNANKLCLACFNGDYPMDVPHVGNKYIFEKN